MSKESQIHNNLLFWDANANVAGGPARSSQTTEWGKNGNATRHIGCNRNGYKTAHGKLIGHVPLTTQYVSNNILGKQTLNWTMGQLDGARTGHRSIIDFRLCHSSSPRSEQLKMLRTRAQRLQLNSISKERKLMRKELGVRIAVSKLLLSPLTKRECRWHYLLVMGGSCRRAFI